MKAQAAANTALKTGEPLGSARCSWTPNATQQSACSRSSVLLRVWPRKPLERAGQSLGPGVGKGDELESSTALEGS